MVYPILWVFPLAEGPDGIKFFKMDGHVGYSKDPLPEMLKIDKFDSAMRNNAGALHGVGLGSGDLWFTGCLFHLPVRMCGKNLDNTTC